jgi:hypothetical protein
MSDDSNVRLDYDQGLVLRECVASGEPLDEVYVPSTRCGCALEEIAESPLGNWIVGRRCSGQGEWGYDIITGSPLRRVAGIEERPGYMLDLPVFADDESYLVGAYGERWLGGWWAHPEDDHYETPSRGGRHDFGWIFRHSLPSHNVEWMHLVMDIPKGWFPDDPEDYIWAGARCIRPFASGVRLELPGGTEFTISNWSKEVVVPTPNPNRDRLR